ncbi:MAG: GntR family transcriptional regulator [Actinobacteria bacterium]|nr:GntR family transcriptional regulator [Actinomycetota bacterium]MBO0786395.1 GntR family transcriptional regulator [Actinomycetota bacterium]
MTTLGTQPAEEPGVIRPVQRPVPLRQSVYESLVELVVDGRLQPGQHLVETELARLLGVSRQPVREALHRLEAEGWVDLRPNQGAFVHVPTDQEVDELLDVRELLEVETARLAARAARTGRGSKEQLSSLREICREGEAAVEAGDTERFVTVNNRFHAALAALAGNAVLAEVTGIVGRRVRWYYRLVAPMRGAGSSAEHLELVEAIEAGDEERAAKAARDHTERTRTAYHRPGVTEWGLPRFQNG